VFRVVLLAIINDPEVQIIISNQLNMMMSGAEGGTTIAIAAIAIATTIAIAIATIGRTIVEITMLTKHPPIQAG
jgi:hypothetical protein